MRKFYMVCCAVLLAASIFYTALGDVLILSTETQEHGDGLYAIVQTTLDQTKIITEYDADGSLFSTATLKVRNGKRYVVVDYGDEIHKTILDLKTNKFQIYIKKNGEPDTAYQLKYDNI